MSNFLYLIPNNWKKKKEETHILAFSSRVTVANPDINEISADQERRKETH